MTRADLVTLTQSMLADSSGTAFSVALVRLRLNAAYAAIQHHVDLVDPEAFIRRAQVNVVANQARYQRPNFERLRRYEWLLDDSTYAEIEPLVAEQALAVHGVRSRPTYSGIKWYHEGQEVVLVPTPTTARTGGLVAAVVLLVELTADGDVPRLPAALHEFIALGAAVRLLGDESRDGAAAPVDRLRARWEAMFPDSPTRESLSALKLHYRRAQGLTLSGGGL